MTSREEKYILNSLDNINDFLDSELKVVMKEVHENNIMLKEIIKVINTYLSRHHQENEDDFIRNVIANLISGRIDLITNKK
jgi:hypothetical protein